MNIEYRTEYYKDPTSKAILIIFSFLVVVGISIGIMKMINSKPINLILSFLIMGMFIIILIFLRKKQIKYATLIFNETELVINISELDSEILITQEIFLLKDIASYKFYFDTKKNTCLTIYRKNKSKSTFIFKDGKTYEEALSQESVFSLFYSFVSKYENNGVKIIPTPSLLATKTGKYIIWCEVSLLLIAFLIHLIKNNFSHAYYLILGIGLLIPQIVNRIQNRAMHDKISKIDN